MTLWDETTPTEPDPRREREGGRVVWLVLVGLVLLVAGGYTAAYLSAGDKVPRGATVAGVEIGGRTPEGAASALEAGLADRADAPINVKVDGSTESVSPEEAGLSVDYAASVEQAGGEQSWEPTRLWDYYTGGDDLDAVVDVDEDAMEALVKRLAGDLGTEPTDGAVAFRNGEIVVTDPVAGDAIDPDEARDALVAAYLSDDDAELTLSPSQPEIDDADVQAALDDFANPALSGPVTLVFGDSRIRLQPREFAPVLGMKAEDGALVPSLNTKKLTTLVASGISDDGAPVDASFEVVDGKPRVIPAKPGVTYDPADVTDAFLTLVAKSEGEREMKVEATVDEPEFTTKDARALKIKEQVSTFTTYFPYAEYRNINIGRAAELVNGTVLEPGETFSLNGVVGERTRENGFTEGFIISNGIFKEDLGGGVSQMATTTFNAMFFAGLEDIEHKPHSFYIDRYPVGREATVAWGAVDLQFRNDTPYGVLIEANLNPSTGSSQGELTVSMYSTKYWDITTRTGDRYAYVSPATRTLDTPDCYPNTGYSGFQIDVWRYFKKPGSDELDHSEKFHTSYTPSDTVICKPPGSID
ncbi:vanomycin resistance protein VanB [Nocardioides szechwanensis]|uniref:Vancomycin resistance protein YoaR, contains peptidoglycan-binding and VanW domains n=1 Tax=Nocardioides szechwanensis TaxID=1005944 RepID=A0A1H0AG31_9ACTN|nr:VanW family protein [Nocardioides szechwanensis]GEP34866.1 vanomycin resistance protein VanB [Nocardioides szechwanensis]SDN32479.1 Vancomycin resistance protein YoaR, contains peptidoglycan-binding and VanW domains [Nocardioides szechwanensis]